MSICFGWILCTDIQRQRPLALHSEKQGSGRQEREGRREAGGGRFHKLQSTSGAVQITA